MEASVGVCGLGFRGLGFGVKVLGFRAIGVYWGGHWRRLQLEVSGLVANFST